MGSTSLHPSGTRAARTDPTLTSTARDRGPGATAGLEHRAVALFIGGAGDKRSYYLAGPYRNIAYALSAFDRRMEEAGQADGYQSLYLGYHEVWSAAAIGRLIMAEIHDKDTPIYIVGHSLGAWSGAHLSHQLSEWGYRVEMLVTLDPVGSGLLARMTSNIPYQRPAPHSRFWINVRAEPGRPNASDMVAQLGRKWHVAGEPDVDEAVDANHANASALFCTPLHDGRSAADHMFESIVGQLRG